MSTRLDNLVLVLAPAMLGARLHRERPMDTAELGTFVIGVVSLAELFDRAIADVELRQMTPPKGDRSGP